METERYPKGCKLGRCKCGAEVCVCDDCKGICWRCNPKESLERYGILLPVEWVRKIRENLPKSEEGL